MFITTLIDPDPDPVPDPGWRKPMRTFDHERLDVYKIAIKFVADAEGLIQTFPRGRGYLSDQLRRAASSIPLNIAEGCGEFSKSDKARFYRMALRSATECGAILDVCKCLGAVKGRNVSAGHELLVRIVAMLTRMVRNLAKPGSGSGTGSGSGGD